MKLNQKKPETNHNGGPGPQVKICGLTDPGQAAACARLGAHAIGLVFYPRSPRHLSLEQATAICAALPPRVCKVGVFVDPAWDTLTRTIEHCGLTAVQLHGSEKPAMVEKLLHQKQVAVFKALFVSKQPGLNQAAIYRPTAFLVECGQGVLPGGNAKTWDWAGAAVFAGRHSTILAGGLDPYNVDAAIAACLPAAVDASSGLEAAPGRKDLSKVDRFIQNVRQTNARYAAAGRVLAPVF